MIELIKFILLLVLIWAVGYISEKQHDDIKEEIKKLNDKINQLKKRLNMTQEERYKHYYNAGYNAGCVKGYEQAIEKACEWLKEAYPKAAAYYEHQDSFIDQFKKAMKGE